MTIISFPFSFSIMLHKKSHFLSFLLIMNCTVLCPIGLYSQRPKTPTEEQCWCHNHWQRAEFNKAMGNSFPKEGNDVWRQEDSSTGPKAPRCTRGRMHWRCPRHTHEHTDVYINADVINWTVSVNVLNTVIQCHRKKAKKRCNFWRHELLIVCLDCPPVTPFLPAWRQQTGLSAKPPHHQRSPHSLVWGDKRLRVDYRISGILHPGWHYSGNKNL